MEDAELRDLVKRLRGEDKSLNEILDILHKEHEVRITFLDLRVLVAEIEKSKPVETKKKKEPKGFWRRGKDKDKKDTKPTEPSGATTVEVDQVMRPGAQLSGNATLKSGAKVNWFFDSTGRLGLELQQGSAQPTQQDLKDFQRVLASKLQPGG